MIRKPGESDGCSLLAVVLMVSLWAAPAGAQVIYGGSLGSAERHQSARTQPKSPYYKLWPALSRLSQFTYAVESAYGEVSGQNLFHDFSQFVIGSEETVGLVGDGQFESVFLRVDSGIVVDGLLTSEHAGADIYLLSRHGIAVGSGGLFDVPGGLTLSTADGVIFESGSFTTDGSSGLSNGCCQGDPVALGFEGGYHHGTSAQVEIQGSQVSVDADPVYLLGRELSGDDGNGIETESFRVVAESVSIANRFVVLEGEKVIHLAAVGEAELTVPLDLMSPTPGIEALGPEALVELDHVFLGGDNPLPQSRVLLEGGILRLEGGSKVITEQMSDDIAVEFRAGRAIELYGVSVTSNTAFSPSESELNKPSIYFDAPRISLVAEVMESGEIARSEVEVAGGLAWLSGGLIELESSDLVAQVRLAVPIHPLGSDLESEKVGIYLDAREELVLSGQSTLKSYPPQKESLDWVADIQISAGSFKIVDGSQVSSLTMNGHSGGDIFVDVGGTFLISGVSPSSDTSGATTRSWLGAHTQEIVRREHNGVLEPEDVYWARHRIDSGTTNGNIRVRAGRLEISDGGLITGRSKTLAGSGNIDIQVDGLLRLSGEMLGERSEIASRAGLDDGSGDGGIGGGGSIVVNAGRIEMEEGTAISATSYTRVPGGEVNLTATSDMLIRGARIYTQAPQGELGGDVRLNAGERIELVDAKVETHVAWGDGNAGRIELGLERAPRYLVLNQSDLRTTADQGTGGNIDVVAENFLMSKTASLDTKSRRGVDGLVSINAPEVQAAGQVEPLPASYLDVSALLQSHCAARPGAGSSSFTIEGRPGLPAPLDGFRPGAASSPSPRDAGGSQSGGSVREQLERFDLGCGRDWRLASRPG